MSNEPRDEDRNENANPDVRIDVDESGKVKSVSLDLDLLEYVIVGAILIGVTYIVGSWGVI